MLRSWTPEMPLARPMIQPIGLNTRSGAAVSRALQSIQSKRSIVELQSMNPMRAVGAVERY